MVYNNDYRGLKGHVLANFLSLMQDQAHLFSNKYDGNGGLFQSYCYCMLLCMCIVTVYTCMCHHQQIPLRVLDMVVVGVEAYFIVLFTDNRVAFVHYRQMLNHYIYRCLYYDYYLRQH